MKIKNDFITNSSSTSHIIGKLKPGNTKIKIEVEIDSDQLEYETYKTFEEFKKSDYYYDFEHYYDDVTKEKIMHIFNNGYVLQILKVGNDYGSVGSILYENDDLFIKALESTPDLILVK